jgi:hypothetical protein
MGASSWLLEQAPYGDNIITAISAHGNPSIRA